MILFPAIDLKDGQCVRLKLGDMDQATVYNPDPAAQARAFEDQGFEWLHVVDLNGAFAGESVNGAAVDAILKATKNPVQLGGGIRTLDHIESWLSRGLSRVILGTVAVRDPRSSSKPASASRARSPLASTPRAARLPSRLGGSLRTRRDRTRAAFRRRRRCGDHLYRHRPRRDPDRHQLGLDAGTGRCRFDPVIASAASPRSKTSSAC